MDKVYYYSRIKKNYIHNVFYDLDNNYIFMVSLSSPNKWNVSVNEEDDGDYLDTNDNKISDLLFI